MKIAVIGAGISGLATASLLSQKHDVVVYDKNTYIGGHSNTVSVKLENQQPFPVDTGFIVFNKKNYPLLTEMFNVLQVQICESNMSFGVSLQNKEDFEYCSDIPFGLFANPFNFLKLSYWSFLNEIIKFNNLATKTLTQDYPIGETLQSYLEKHNFSINFINRYLIPMAAAIWSAPFNKILEFPLSTFLNFMNNHGLLSVSNRPQWYTVKGGSQEYVKKLITPFKNFIKFQKVISINRVEGGVQVTSLNQTALEEEIFDQVVLATHADEALELIKSPTTQEKQILEKFSYQENKTYLHTDCSLMPKQKRAWASWNGILQENIKDKNSPVCVTYWMNKLQKLPTNTNIFVTLNPSEKPKNILREFVYSHPLYNYESLQAQQHLHTIQGHDRIWFCGSYFGYGFHEDALKSGVAVAQSLGCSLNWHSVGASYA